MFIWLFILALVRSFPDGIAGFDLATGTQTLWLLGEGQSPNPSLLGGESYLAQTAAYIIYPLSVITRIFPTANTILFLQSLALSLAVIPIFNIARNLGKLHFGTSTAVVFVYGTYVSLHSANLSGFSPVILALPAMFYVLYLGLNAQGRLTELGWKFHTKYWLCILFVLACRADVGLALTGFGFLLVAEKKRALGWLTVGVNFIWLLVAIFFVQNILGDGFAAVSAYGDYGSNPFSVFWGMVTNPLEVIDDLRTEENIGSIIGLLAPLVFLPLARPRFILPAIPLYFFYLMADVPADILGEAEQAIPVMVFLFVAMIFALRRIGHILVERVRVNLFLVWILVAASVMFFIQNSPSTFYEEPWHWNNRQTILEEVVDEVPEEVSVAASTNLLANLAEREELIEIPADFSSITEIVRKVRNVDWVVLDSTTTFSDNIDTQNFIQAMTSNGWEVTRFADGLYSFQK